MTNYTHQTAPTQFVETGGIRFAYRRFGKAGGLPLVFNQHYTGTMDYWDPLVTDGIAKNREVILFNNAGISSSSGEVPATFEEMGTNAIAFIRALGLKKVDVLGFSMGGLVAQEITLQAPELVRRLILVGTGPRGGEGMQPMPFHSLAVPGPESSRRWRWNRERRCAPAESQHSFPSSIARQVPCSNIYPTGRRPSAHGNKC